MKNNTIRFCAMASGALLFTFVTTEANAQTFDVGTRSAAMGGTGVATAVSGDAIVNNPAALGGGGIYSVEGSYLYRPNSHVVSAAVTDSKTNPMVSAGVGYSFLYGVNDLKDITGHDVRFGVAVPAYQHYLVLGIGGRYTLMFQKIAGAKDPLELVKGFTLSAGLVARPLPGLSLGFAALNLIPQCSKEVCKSFMSMQFNTGIGYSIAGLTATVDVDVDIDLGNPAVDVGAGLEYIVLDMIPLRLGYRHVDVGKRNLITAGLGYTSHIVDVNVSYQGDVSHSKYHVVSANVILKL